MANEKKPPKRPRSKAQKRTATRGAGRPRKDESGAEMKAVSVMLSPRNLEALDNARIESRLKLNRSEIIRAAIDALQDAKVPLGKAESEAELRETIVERLRR